MRHHWYDPIRERADRDTGSDAPPPADLFEQLRVIRRTLARARGVPPYVVFGDASLVDMARRLPTTPEEFRRVKGVGDTRATTLAEHFLPPLQACLQGGRRRAQREDPGDLPEGPVWHGENGRPHREGPQWRNHAQHVLSEPCPGTRRMKLFAHRGAREFRPGARLFSRHSSNSSPRNVKEARSAASLYLENILARPPVRENSAHSNSEKRVVGWRWVQATYLAIKPRYMCR